MDILDGKSLEGWRSDLPAGFEVVEGGVIAKKAKGKGNARLYFFGDDSEPDIFERFEVRIRAHLEGEKGNSGFFFHLPPGGVEKRMEGGLEVNIANGTDLKNQTGSIWDVKANCGVVSNELHNKYVKGWKVLDVVVSGFYDSVGLYDDSGAAEWDRAREWLEALGIEYLEKFYYHEISPGIRF